MGAVVVTGFVVVGLVVVGFVVVGLVVTGFVVVGFVVSGFGVVVGVVSDNGMLIKASYANRCAVTTSKLTGNQIYAPTSGGGRKRIIGHQEAWKAVYGMNGKYPGKIATTLFVAVPYALNPEERGPHAGYLENLRLNFAAAMDAEFRLAAQKHVIAWKGTTNDYIQLAYDQDDTRLVNIPKKRGRKKGSGGGYMGSAGGGMKMRP